MKPIPIKNMGTIAHAFFIALCYGAFLACFMLFLHKRGFMQDTIDEHTLLEWDSGIYKDIMLHGYTYVSPRNNNSGCFVFYPWIWRLLHAGVVAMCCFNYSFFAAGFAIISSLYKITTTEKLLWLSVSTVYMMMIPYTEALFFLQMSAVFYGITKGKKWIIWIGLITASMTRPTGIFLLPAFLVMEFVCGTEHRKWYKILLHYFLDYAIPIITGLGFFIWYQHYKFGYWFAYFIQQQNYEGHVFSIPVLPFTSLEGPRMLWISALAVFCCVLSLIVITIKILKRITRKITEPDKLLVVSMIYMVLTLYKTIFYNPKWGAGLTILVGISRYIFATPFFYVLLYYFTRRSVQYKISNFVFVFILCNAVWLLCGSYVHIQWFINFNFLTLIVVLYMLLADNRQSWVPMILMAINVVLQVVTFQQYLNGLYLD